MHPTGDQTVLYYHGKDLYELAKEPKEIWDIDSTEHINSLSDKNTQIAFTEKIEQLLHPSDKIFSRKAVSYSQSYQQ